MIIPLNKYISLGFYITLLLVLFFPSIHLTDTFRYRIEWITTPVFFIFSLFFIKTIFELKKYLLALLVVFLIMAISISINIRTNEINDFYEFAKIALFVMALCIFYIYIKHKGFEKTLKFFHLTFIIIVIANILHYFNLFLYNYSIQTAYSDFERILFFGLNSLGIPDAKRMLGIMGNPNNNAIYLLFFNIIFLCTLNNKTSKVLYYVSLFMIAICMSNTGYLSLFVITVISFFVIKTNIKEKIIRSVIFIAIILFANYMPYVYFSRDLKKNDVKDMIDEKYYALYGKKLSEKQKKAVFEIIDATHTSFFIDFNISSYLSNTLFVDRSSFNKRLEIWAFLLEQAKKKPVFGHGPNKNYFYENNIYSEGEYILYLWRYGVFGLVAYFLLVLSPLFFIKRSVGIRKALNERNFQIYFFFMCVILITALTNNPLCESRISFLFAFTVSLIPAILYKKHKNEFT